MDIVTLDLETYYDKEYTLRKLTTEAYIRHPLYETIGVGLKVNGGATRWIPKPLVAKALGMINWDNVACLCFNTAFDALILSHHYGIRPRFLMDAKLMARPFVSTKNLSLAFLTSHLGVGEKTHEVDNAIGKRYADFTPEELARYGEYCCNDCDITYDCMQALLPKIPFSELRFIDAVLRTFTEPSLLWNTELLQLHHADIVARKAALLQRVSDIAPVDTLSSNAKFLGILERLGGRWPRSMVGSDEAYEAYLTTLRESPAHKPHLFDIPTKKREATAKEQEKGITGEVEVWALAKKDEEFLALQEIDDDVLQAVLDARLGTKSTIAETRAARMIDAATRGAYPIALAYYAAHTGRLGGTEASNPQNFPKAKALTADDISFQCMTPVGTAQLLSIAEGTAITDKGEFPLKKCSTISIRHALTAPEGYSMVVADASQIEARIVAWVAGQDDLVQAFREGKDIYSEFASEVYGYEVSKKLPVERFVGKTCILGLGFGTGHVKLQGTLAVGQGDIKADISLEEAKRIVNTYRKVKYPRIPEFWEVCSRALVAAYEGREMFFGPGNILRTSQDTIWLPNGMPIRYTNLKWVVEDNGEKGFKYWGKKDGRYQWVRLYGAKCVENIVQALARICVSDAWVRIRNEYPVAMQVHDELVCVVPTPQAQIALARMNEEMSKPPAWAAGLPLAAEGDVGVCYADAK